MDHSPFPDEFPYTEPTRPRAGHLFANADPDVILSMTGYILNLAEQGVSLAHESVLKMQERREETPGAPTA